MYNVPHFKANNEAEVFEFMKAHPFVTICGIDKNGLPIASHIPILIKEVDDKIFVQGHFMRKQEHTNAFELNENILVIFTGNHTYISATNYTTQNVASTWNYQAIHANGILKMKDEAFLLDLLTNLTSHFENNQNSKALVKNMDEAYVNNLMKAIVGFEIELTKIQHIFKLSQNKDEQSRNNVIEHLSKSEKSNEHFISEEMKKHYTNKL